MLKSLKSQLLVFWLILVLVFVTLALAMYVLFQTSAAVVIEEAQAETAQSCRAIATRYEKSIAQPEAQTPQVDLLNVLLRLVLIERPHVEGGVWQTGGGFLAYAYPTYEGSRDKRDVPEAEQAHITELAQVAARTQELQTDTVRGTREALVLSACPLISPDHTLVAWTMTRAASSSIAARNGFRSLVGGLLLVVVLTGLWLGTIWQRGLRHVRHLEAQMASAPLDDDSIPLLSLTGVVELDRIVAGFNRYRTRYVSAQERLREASSRSAHEQRLATLGRMTGGIAHEIRNPIATMRLKAENALVAPPERQAAALVVIIDQISRLDRLVQSLLAVVQPLQLQPAALHLEPWLKERLDAVAAKAAARGIRLALDCQDMVVEVDPLHVGRAIDNLLDNAVRHARANGMVSVSTRRPSPTTLAIRVDDDGPGVDPAVRSQMFEPFATGRPDGTGLGLALAREVAVAHGGELRYVALNPGSRFELEFPCPAS